MEGYLAVGVTVGVTVRVTVVTSTVSATNAALNRQKVLMPMSESNSA